MSVTGILQINMDPQGRKFMAGKCNGNQMATAEIVWFPAAIITTASPLILLQLMETQS